MKWPDSFEESGHFALVRRCLGASAGDEVHDDGDDGEDEQQVDEEAADMEECESAEPKHDENDREDEKHGTFFQNEDFRVLHLAESYKSNSTLGGRTLHDVREGFAGWRCFPRLIPSRQRWTG